MTIVRVKYCVEGLYKSRESKDREWLVWMWAGSKDSAIRTYKNGLKLRGKTEGGFSELRVVEITEHVEVIQVSQGE